MRLVKLSIVWLLVLSSNAIAQQWTVDIFGDDSSLGQWILKKHMDQIERYKKMEFELITHPEKITEHRLRLLYQNKKKLFEQIKNEGKYLYVDIEQVNYPKVIVPYLTLEVIRSQDKARLRWVEPQISLVSKKTDRPRFISDMIHYQALGAHLAMIHEIDMDHVRCPKLHCTFGYQHPKLKPYQKRFEQVLRNRRDEVLVALKSKDPEVRAAAVYVVGEMDVASTIIDTLTPCVIDSDAGVRNNAIRVIGETLQRHHTPIDIKPYLELLQSPNETDRNKSLLVLLSQTSFQKQKAIIREKAFNTLTQLAHLHQPNNREPAQLILDKLK